MSWHTSGSPAQKELSCRSLPILFLLFVVMWLLVIRPQRKRQQEQRRVIDNLSPGQEVLTAGGSYGTVHSLLGDDEVRIEIAPDVHVRVARRAIAAVLDRRGRWARGARARPAGSKKEVLAAHDAGER